MASSHWETLLGCGPVSHCPSAFNDKVEPRASDVLGKRSTTKLSSPVSGATQIF